MVPFSTGKVRKGGREEWFLRKPVRPLPRAGVLGVPPQTGSVLVLGTAYVLGITEAHRGGARGS